jgi:hypothetical protein
MNLNYVLTSLLTRRWELHLPVDAAETEQGGVKDVDTVRCHDNLEISSQVLNTVFEPGDKSIQKSTLMLLVA